MTKDEALRMALEALENHEGNYKLEKAGAARSHKAITAIKQALAAPVQEGVTFNEELHQERERRKQLEAELMRMQGRELKLQMALNTPAAQRQWVGLTPDDIRQLEKENTVGGLHGDYCPTWDLIELVEAKLKEKNT